MIDDRVKFLNDFSDWAICASKAAKKDAIAVGFLDVALQAHSLSCLIALLESTEDLVTVQIAGRSLLNRLTPKELILKGSLDKIKQAPGFRRSLDEAVRVFLRAKRQRRNGS